MSVHYIPWIGKNYWKDNETGGRLLILGESHYGDEEPDATIRYTKGYVEGEFSARFWTIIMQIVTGLHHWDIDRKAFWGSVALYNFIQESVGDDARIRPTLKMWQNAQEPFWVVLRELKPSHLLVLGSALWENLPDEGRPYTEIIVNGERRETWAYPHSGGEVIATWVYHPCSIRGASSSESYPFVRELLKLRMN